MADAADSKSASLDRSGGSSPPLGTILPSTSPRPFSAVKHAALAADLLGSVLHEVNNAAQYLAAMDALCKHVGADVVGERDEDLAACGASLAAQGELLAALCGEEARPACTPRAARLLWTLVKKRLAAEQRPLDLGPEGPVDRLDFEFAARVLVEARLAPAGARLALDFERGTWALVAT